MTAVLLVVAGASIGAPARWLLDRSVRSAWPRGVPWGTLLVNLIGSLLLGVVLGMTDGSATGTQLSLLLGTGFCGAFTTFSTFSFEAVRLVEEAQSRSAAAYLALSLLLGCLLAIAGWSIGTLVVA